MMNVIDLLVFRVLKKRFCKNLHLALLFQILLEDTQQKIQINFSCVQLNGIPIKLFKTVIISTIAVPLLSSYKLFSLLNPLSANSTKWSNRLKQIVGNSRGIV